MDKIEIEKIVKDVINESLNESLAIENESSLVKLGIDSVDIVSILVLLDQRLSIELPAESFDGIDTVQDVIDALYEYMLKAH